MTEQTKTASSAEGKTGILHAAGEQIPFVVIRLPDGSLALRHPKEVGTGAAPGGEAK